MTNDEIACAVRFILEGKGKPVTLYVRRIPGRAQCQVTNLLPVGRLYYANVTAGRYTSDITINELRQDLNAAEAELGRRHSRAASAERSAA